MPLDIVACALHERFAEDGVAFATERGEIFGILGADGAGKTTTVECIVGLRRPDSGAIRVPSVAPGSMIASRSCTTVDRLTPRTRSAL